MLKIKYILDNGLQGKKEVMVLLLIVKEMYHCWKIWKEDQRIKQVITKIDMNKVIHFYDLIIIFVFKN